MIYRFFKCSFLRYAWLLMHFQYHKIHTIEVISILEWRVGGIFYYSLVVQLEFIMRKTDLSDSDFKIENVELAFSSNCSLNTFENLSIYKLIFH
jgi:hypothetical protein